MHAGRREPPRQPLEQFIAPRRRLDAGVRRLGHGGRVRRARRLARLAPPRGGRPRGPDFVDDRKSPPAVRVHARRDPVVRSVLPEGAVDGVDLCEIKQ